MLEGAHACPRNPSRAAVLRLLDATARVPYLQEQDSRWVL
jgi:hypothetical protein